MEVALHSERGGAQSPCALSHALLQAVCDGLSDTAQQLADKPINV